MRLREKQRARQAAVDFYTVGAHRERPGRPAADDPPRNGQTPEGEKEPAARPGTPREDRGDR